MGSSIMISPSIGIREGTTGRIVMQLLADDESVDLSDVHHVEMEMRDSRRNTYHYSSLDASPKVGISDGTDGMVYLDPPASLFKTVLEPYLFYFWVYEEEEKKYSVPEEIEAMFRVRRNY